MYEQGYNAMDTSETSTAKNIAPVSAPQTIQIVELSGADTWLGRFDRVWIRAEQHKLQETIPGLHQRVSHITLRRSGRLDAMGISGELLRP